jgi:hypothetical protein
MRTAFRHNIRANPEKVDSVVDPTRTGLMQLSAEQEAIGDGQALCGRPERRGGPTDR